MSEGFQINKEVEKSVKTTFKKEWKTGNLSRTFIILGAKLVALRDYLQLLETHEVAPVSQLQLPAWKEGGDPVQTFWYLSVKKRVLSSSNLNIWEEAFKQTYKNALNHYHKTQRLVGLSREHRYKWRKIEKGIYKLQENEAWKQEVEVLRTIQESLVRTEQIFRNMRERHPSLNELGIELAEYMGETSGVIYLIDQHLEAIKNPIFFERMKPEALLLREGIFLERMTEFIRENQIPLDKEAFVKGYINLVKRHLNLEEEEKCVAHREQAEREYETRMETEKPKDKIQGFPGETHLEEEALKVVKARNDK